MYLFCKLPAPCVETIEIALTRGEAVLRKNGVLSRRNEKITVFESH